MLDPSTVRLPAEAEPEVAKRLSFLAAASEALSSSLDYATTLQRVAQLAVPRLADWCAVDIVDEDGAVSRLAIAHIDPDKAAWAHELSRRSPFNPDAPLGLARVLRTGEPEYYPELTDEMIAAAARDEETLVAARALGLRSAMIAPLVARGRTLGAITLVRAESGHHYIPDDLTLVGELARRAALAVDNAHLYAAEQRARESAERTARQLARLQALTTTLGTALTPSEVAAAVIGPDFGVLGARGVAIAQLAAGESMLELLGTAGYPDAHVSRRRRIRLSAETPLPDAVQRGEPIFLGSREEMAERYPRLIADPLFADDTALAAVPLMVEGRVLGGMALSFSVRQAFDPEERAFLLAVAHQCAQALDRARLYQAAQDARAATEAARQRQAFLAEVSSILASSLDYEETLSSVAELAVPRFADWCIVHILAPDGSLQQVAIAHADAERRNRVWDGYLHHFTRHAHPHPIAEVLGTGDAVLTRSLGPAEWEVIATDADHLRLIETIAPRSAIVAPLVAQGRQYGVVSFICSESDRHYGLDDLALARDLAQRAAVAVDNARLYREVEQYAARVTALAEASQAFTEASLNVQRVLDSVTRRAAELVGDLVIIRLLDEGSEWLRPVAMHHPDPEALAFVRDLLVNNPLRADEGIGGRVLQTGETLRAPVGPSGDIRALVKEPYLAYHERFGGNSVLMVPLTVRGRAIGTLSLFRDSPESLYTLDEENFVQDLAGRAALAIENARLFQTAQSSAARTKALAAAARAFAEASLDLPTVVETVVRRIAELVGDGCLICLRSSDRQVLEPAASYHADPEALDLARSLLTTPEPRLAEWLREPALAQREPVLIAPVDLERHRALIRPEYRAYLDRFPLRSLLIVPLRVRDRALGTLLAWRDQSLQPYTAEDQTFVTDLAGRAALAIENARLYQESQDAVRAREIFLSTASHELKTPLTTIKGYGQLLLRFLNQPQLDRRHLLELGTQLQGQIGRFEALVNDLLDVSRIQQGRLALRCEPIDLAKLTADVVARFEQSGERTPRHRLVLEASTLEGEWDPTRLDQVLTNLVSNALKYSPDGGIVRIVVRRRDGMAEIGVTDHGIGIPPEERARLFQPFVRGTKARAQAGGTGLGLYIARQIVEQHAGTIEVCSQPGAGTTVIVRLPLTLSGSEQSSTAALL